METRNRKRMDENPWEADFELRVGVLRVYHGVDEDARCERAGCRFEDRDRVMVGGEEIEL